jgi:hypothetical protein
MPKSVAIAEDVENQPAAGFALQGTVVVKLDPKITVGKKPIAVAATATFVNSNSGATAVVQLNGSHKLQGASGGVLADGDQAAVSGNTLRVSASGKLRTD